MIKDIAYEKKSRTTRKENPYSSVDKETVEEIYRRYRTLVERRCFEMLRDKEDASDAAQEVFVLLITKGSQFRQEAQWKTWLYRVATNVCINRYKYQKRRNRWWRKDVFEFQKSFSSDSELGVLLKNVVEKTVANCDSITTQAAYQYFVESKNQQNIGKHLGLSRMTVNKRITRFRNAFCSSYNAI